METTVVYSGYTGIMEKTMGTTIRAPSNPLPQTLLGGFMIIYVDVIGVIRPKALLTAIDSLVLGHIYNPA